jgi:hypothetical protein
MVGIHEIFREERTVVLADVQFEGSSLVFKGMYGLWILGLRVVLVLFVLGEG